MADGEVFQMPPLLTPGNVWGGASPSTVLSCTTHARASVTGGSRHACQCAPRGKLVVTKSFSADEFEGVEIEGNGAEGGERGRDDDVGEGAGAEEDVMVFPDGDLPGFAGAVDAAGVAVFHFAGDDGDAFDFWVVVGLEFVGAGAVELVAGGVVVGVVELDGSSGAIDGDPFPGEGDGDVVAGEEGDADDVGGIRPGFFGGGFHAFPDHVGDGGVEFSGDGLFPGLAVGLQLGEIPAAESMEILEEGKGDSPGSGDDFANVEPVLRGHRVAWKCMAS